MVDKLLPGTLKALFERVQNNDLTPEKVLVKQGFTGNNVNESVKISRYRNRSKERQEFT